MHIISYYYAAANLTRNLLICLIVSMKGLKEMEILEKLPAGSKYDLRYIYIVLRLEQWVTVYGCQNTKFGVKSPMNLLCDSVF